MAGFVDTNTNVWYAMFYDRSLFGRGQYAALDYLDLEGQEEQCRRQVLIEDSGPSGPVQEPTPEVLRRLAASDEMLRAVRAAGGDFSRFSSAQLADLIMTSLTAREQQLLLADYNRRKATGQWGPAPAASRRGPAKAAQKPPRRGFWRGLKQLP